MPSLISPPRRQSVSSLSSKTSTSKAAWNLPRALKVRNNTSGVVEHCINRSFFFCSVANEVHLMASEGKRHQHACYVGSSVCSRYLSGS